MSPAGSRKHGCVTQKEIRARDVLGIEIKVETMAACAEAMCCTIKSVQSKNLDKRSYWRGLGKEKGTFEEAMEKGGEPRECTIAQTLGRAFDNQYITSVLKSSFFRVLGLEGVEQESDDHEEMYPVGINSHFQEFCNEDGGLTWKLS